MEMIRLAPAFRILENSRYSLTDGGDFNYFHHHSHSIPIYLFICVIINNRIVIGEASESSKRRQNGDKIEWHDQIKMENSTFLCFLSCLSRSSCLYMGRQIYTLRCTRKYALEQFVSF